MPQAASLLAQMRRDGEAASEYFRENVYMTFQDDWTAFQLRDHMNVERLMWANDFPHSDATWLHSQEMLAEHTADMTQWEKDRIRTRTLRSRCA